MTTEIQTGLAILDCAQSVFSAYANVPATRLSQCLSGVKGWTPQDLAACEKAMREMLDLAKTKLKGNNRPSVDEVTTALREAFEKVRVQKAEEQIVIPMLGNDFMAFRNRGGITNAFLVWIHRIALHSMKLGQL